MILLYLSAILGSYCSTEYMKWLWSTCGILGPFKTHYAPRSNNEFSGYKIVKQHVNKQSILFN